MNLNAKTKYSGLAMLLHWLVFVAVIVSWRIAEGAEEAATREARGEIMANHFALGASDAAIDGIVNAVVRLGD